MKENIYPQEFTWESLGCKDDDTSLTLLNAEINFYETIYNEVKDTLNESDNIDCDLAIDDIKIRINVTLPMLGFSQTFVKHTNMDISTLRKILNVKVKRS